MSNFAKRIRIVYACQLFKALYTYSEKIARRLYAHKIKANIITLSSIGFAVIGLNFTAVESYFAAFVCFALNRFCAILDGMVARFAKPSLFGTFFDIFADHISYALFIFGFILATPQNNGSAGAFYLVSMIVSAVSLLGFAMISGQNYRTLKQSRLKICRRENIQTRDNFIALFLMLLLPEYFMPIALFFGLLVLGKSLLSVSSAYYELEIAPKVKNSHETL